MYTRWGSIVSHILFLSFFFLIFFYTRHFNSFPNIEVLACQGEKKKTCEVSISLSGYPVFRGSAF